MISDKEWLRKLGKCEDWLDDSFTEMLLNKYMIVYDFVSFLKALEKDYKRTKEEEE